MKKLITLAFALVGALSANAQGEYRACHDDVYFVDNNTNCIGKYDEVEEVCDEVSNKLVIHKKVKNVIHVDGEIEERHYSYGKPIGYANYSHRRNVRYIPRRAVTVPKTVNYSSYEPVETRCLGSSDYNDGKWFFFFQLNSDYLTNKEELGHLIDYAKTNPYSVFYIDAYADANTGGYDVNMQISKMRANTIIRFLLSEGINANRLFVRHHGSVSQPYRTNNLNRCVTVSTVLNQ